MRCEAVINPEILVTTRDRSRVPGFDGAISEKDSDKEVEDNVGKCTS
jgi:hypothetical protein